MPRSIPQRFSSRPPVRTRVSAVAQAPLRSIVCPLVRASTLNVLAMVACLAGCASAEPRFVARQAPAALLTGTWQAPCSLDLPQAPLHRRSNVLEPGDEVEVAVTTGRDAVEIARVTSIIDDEGTVVVPRIGRMTIAGAAPRTVENAIVRTCYERGIPTQPLVEVTLKRVRQQQITVLGGVTRPGVCTLSRDRSDLVSVLAAAGGLARNAGDKIVIQRPPGAPAVSAGQTQAGDVILTGEVMPVPQANPGTAAMRQEIDLRALAAGKAPAPTCKTATW